jgi:hypothetical protein
MPIRVLASARRAGAAPDELPLVPEDPEEPVVPAGRVGTDVPVALARHDDATASAELAVDGALLLTVPFPPKLHA